MKRDHRLRRIDDGQTARQSNDNQDKIALIDRGIWKKSRHQPMSPIDPHKDHRNFPHPFREIGNNDNNALDPQTDRPRVDHLHLMYLQDRLIGLQIPTT